MRGLLPSVWLLLAALYTTSILTLIRPFSGIDDWPAPPPANETVRAKEPASPCAANSQIPRGCSRVLAFVSLAAPVAPKLERRDEWVQIAGYTTVVRARAHDGRSGAVRLFRRAAAQGDRPRSWLCPRAGLGERTIWLGEGNLARSLHRRVPAARGSDRRAAIGGVCRAAAGGPGFGGIRRATARGAANGRALTAGDIRQAGRRVREEASAGAQQCRRPCQDGDGARPSPASAARSSDGATGRSASRFAAAGRDLAASSAAPSAAGNSAVSLGAYARGRFRGGARRGA